MPAPPVSVAAVHDIVGFVRCDAAGLKPAGVVGARLSNTTVLATGRRQVAGPVLGLHGVAVGARGRDRRVGVGERAGGAEDGRPAQHLVPADAGQRVGARGPGQHRRGVGGRGRADAGGRRRDGRVVGHRERRRRGALEVRARLDGLHGVARSGVGGRGVVRVRGRRDHRRVRLRGAAVDVVAGDPGPVAAGAVHVSTGFTLVGVVAVRPVGAPVTASAAAGAASRARDGHEGSPTESKHDTH